MRETWLSSNLGYCKIVGKVDDDFDKTEYVIDARLSELLCTRYIVSEETNTVGLVQYSKKLIQILMDWLLLSYGGHVTDLLKASSKEANLSANWCNSALLNVMLHNANYILFITSYSLTGI